jgi:hypothetical protein
MTRSTPLLRNLIPLAYTLLRLLGDALHFLLLCLRPSAALAAENLFLRKQLALYQERHVQPRRATNWRSGPAASVATYAFRFVRRVATSVKVVVFTTLTSPCTLTLNFIGGSGVAPMLET